MHLRMFNSTATSFGHQARDQRLWFLFLRLTRPHRFGLRDSAGCSNCNEPNETPQHRIIGCPNAVRAWELLDELKRRIGLNQLTDISIDNLLGAKDRLSKIELALQSELLLRIISSSERYNPEVLVKASARLIYHSEVLSRELKEKLKAETNQ